MVSAGGLLETSHRIPNLDYDILMRLTLMLTHSSCDTEALFRLMCFNVFAGNRDDHAKNFSYLYDEDDGSWHLSPAYDPYGERYHESAQPPSTARARTSTLTTWWPSERRGWIMGGASILRTVQEIGRD